MAKVIVERPRLGSRFHGKAKGYQRSLQRLSAEGLPGREGIKRRSRGGTKILNEHLGPLRRYLESQVGRPWDKVFSEICAHINRNSAVQDHVRDHVWDYVTVHVVANNGILCSGEGDWGHGQPLHDFWRPFYVCPRTGILKKVKNIRRRKVHQPEQANPPRYVQVSKTVQCRWLDGCWHVVTLRPLPPQPAESKDIDVVLNRPVAGLDADTTRKHYGRAVYAIAKRRLSKRELPQWPIPVDDWN